MIEGRVDQGRGTEGTPIPPSPLRVPRRDLPLPTGGGGRALLRWLVGVHGWAIAIGMLAGIAWMGALAGVPVLIGVAIDRAVVAGDVGAVTTWVLALVGLGVLEAASGALRHWFAVRLYVDTERILTGVVVDRLLDPRSGMAAARSAGQVLAHVEADARRVAAAFDVLCRGAGAVVVVAVVAVGILATDLLLGVVVLAGVPLSLVAMVPLLRPMERRTAAEQARLSDATGLAADLVQGVRVLKGIGAEGEARRRFGAVVGRVRGAALGVARLEAGWEALRVVAPGLLVVAVVGAGGVAVLDGRLAPGQLVAVLGLALPGHAGGHLR